MRMKICEIRRFVKRLTICLTIVPALTSGCSLFGAEAETQQKTTNSRAYYGDLVLGLMADGSVTLPVTGLDFTVGGVLKNIYVSAGDLVKKGDLLAELDDSDLLLALKIANDNYDKALLAYDETVANAEYSMKAEELSLDALVTQLNEKFDDTNYIQTIANAEVMLERKRVDYEDTLSAAGTSEDASRLTLHRKESELEDAVEAHAKTVSELNLWLDEKPEPFDSYTYDNGVASAKTSAERTKKAYEEAVSDLTKAKKDLAPDLRSSEAEVKEAAQEQIDAKELIEYNAKNNYDDAVTNLEIAIKNLSRARSEHEESEATRIQNEIESAEAGVESALAGVVKAAESVEDAKASLGTVVSDNEKKIVTALQSVEDAEVSLKNAADDLSRARSSFRDSLNEKQNSYDMQLLKIDNMQNADSSIQNALYNIETARNELASAENDILKTRVIAPIDGEILNVTKREGERVSENENAPNIFMGAASTSNSFVTIRDLSEIYLSASIPEGDIVGLSVGQKIRAEVDALNGQVLSATIYSISSIPSRDSSGIITYEVIGIFDEFNEDIRDQMSVFITFVKRELKGVLLVPNKAVFMEDGVQYAYVRLEDDTLEKREVICGFSNGTETEVKNGLEAGETVVVGRVSQ